MPEEHGEDCHGLGRRDRGVPQQRLVDERGGQQRPGSETLVECDRGVEAGEPTGYEEGSDGDEGAAISIDHDSFDYRPASLESSPPLSRRVRFPETVTSGTIP
ncbi:hypothetical protein HWV07_11320 [Natronomonas salina]|uniref:hypothetical protein n=1 Tax=Natronomonas salina TaxID=1710540 RepID=UPI0015B4D40E|nr:hypothetical protein [Natronomonas salina]QLD89589.1 hypothetical protein HWV07_11320 [Natronomonas salina]